MVRNYEYEPEPIKKVKGNPNKNMFVLILTIIMFIGISFSTIYFVYRYNDTEENTLQSGLVSLTFQEKSANIDITDAVPMTDEDGKKNSPPYEFTIENTSEIPLNVTIGIDIESATIELSSVKYAFYNEIASNQYEEVKSGTLEELNTAGGTLYTIPEFPAQTSKSMKLVFWIDYYYDQSGGSLTAKIKATGEQYDYIVPSE